MLDSRKKSYCSTTTFTKLISEDFSEFLISTVKNTSI